MEDMSIQHPRKVLDDAELRIDRQPRRAATVDCEATATEGKNGHGRVTVTYSTGSTAVAHLGEIPTNLRD
jgi:hypothetical protein